MLEHLAEIQRLRRRTILASDAAELSWSSYGSLPSMIRPMLDAPVHSDALLLRDIVLATNVPGCHFAQPLSAV